jgi:raffinose/stachyose/melibiose transport system substrate-binding protein
MIKVIRWNALLLILVLALLAACVAPAAAPTGQAAEQAPAAGEKATVLFWDQFADVSDRMDAIVADFNATHPNIEVVRESYDAQAMRDVIKTALTSGSGPDIFYYDLGPGNAGVLAKAGLLLPLDDAYADFGWDKHIFNWTRERSTFDGKSYGVANELEFIGIFYNKQIFQDNGWSEPKDWNEFLALCDKAKAAGLIPIAFANGDSWPSFHMFAMMMNNIVGKERLTQMVSGKESWDNPDTVAAIKMFFVDMNQAGYFVPDVNAVSYDDGNALFQTGKAAMLATGTWMVESLTNPEQTQVPVGFFFLPSINGNPVVVPGGIGSGWVVSSSAKHPQETLEFLNYLISDEMGKRWVSEIRAVPAYPVDTSGLEIPELQAFALDIIGKQAGGMGYNIDVLTPDNFNNVMWDGFAAVLAGAKTPEQQAADLEAAMQEAIAKGNVIDITK